MKKVTAVVIGAGQRGMEVYASYALKYPYELQITAVAEPDAERRERFCALYGIPQDMAFESWEQLLDRPKLADAAFICTQDEMHYVPAMKAMELGYDLLLEKPMSNHPKECAELGQYAKEHGRMLCICYVLRYTPFFKTMKNLLDSGKIGRLVSVAHNENVGFWHMAHSFVRGNWRNSVESSPMILAKSCHDMDILRWLIGADCVNLSSFGGLTYFNSENAPEGAPLRCLDGCKYRDECPYYAPALYLTEDTGWPTASICNDMSLEGRYRALQEGPYGRCVYHCDNDVVDHQVVNFEFANGVTAMFTMCAFTTEMSRTIKLMGTKGEIRGAMEQNEIELRDFATGRTELIQVKESDSGHGGGDYGLMRDMIASLAGEREVQAEDAVHSHIMAFAAEAARLERKVINLKEFEKNL